MNLELAGAITGIVTGIVGIATAFLKISIGKAVTDAKIEVLHHVDQKYISKELVEAHMEDLERRVDIIERVRHPRTR